MEIQELLEKLKDGFTYEEVDGKIVFTPNAKKPNKKEGYFVDQIGKVQRIEYNIEIEKTKGVFPTYSSCEWFGLVMPQLLCKYKELDVNYNSSFCKLVYSHKFGGWTIKDMYSSAITLFDFVLPFRFPRGGVAMEFLERNRDLLNKIKDVQYT